jgi:hypothetical protein
MNEVASPTMNFEGSTPGISKRKSGVTASCLSLAPSLPKEVLEALEELLMTLPKTDFKTPLVLTSTPASVLGDDCEGIDHSFMLFHRNPADIHGYRMKVIKEHVGMDLFISRAG